MGFMVHAQCVLGDFLTVFQIPVKLNNTLDIRLVGDLWTNCSEFLWVLSTPWTLQDVGLL